MTLPKVISRVILETKVLESLKKDCATGTSPHYVDVQRELQGILGHFLNDFEIPAEKFGTYSHHITYLRDGSIGIIIGRPIATGSKSSEYVSCIDVKDKCKDFIDRCAPLKIEIKSYLPINCSIHPEYEI